MRKRIKLLESRLRDLRRRGISRLTTSTRRRPRAVQRYLLYYVDGFTEVSLIRGTRIANII